MCDDSNDPFSLNKHNLLLVTCIIVIITSLQYFSVVFVEEFDNQHVTTRIEVEDDATHSIRVKLVLFQVCVG